MKILVTGTAGFIGFHMVDKLINAGYEVVGLDSINDYYDVRVKYGRLEQHGIAEDDIEYGKTVAGRDGYKFVRMNLEDRESIDKLFHDEKFDKVCSLAAQAGVRYSIENPKAYIDSNIVGFMNILEAVRHNDVSSLAYASSSSVYGLNTAQPFSTSDNVDHPMALYAASKKSNELMAHTYSHLFNIPTTGLRFFTVYGPWGRPDMSLFLFTKAILEGKPIKVFNHGDMQRDFTYIDDIVEGVFRVIENPAKPNKEWDPANPDPGSSSAPYKIYNIGNNSPVRLMDFISAIEKKIGKVAEKQMMPLQAGDVPSTYANVDDLVRDMDYKPETTIEEGVEKFVDWYRTFFNH